MNKLCFVAGVSTNEPKDSKKIESKPIKTIASKKEKKTKNLKLERLDDFDKSTVVNNAYGTCVKDMQGKALKIKIDILNNRKNVQMFYFVPYVKETVQLKTHV